MDDFYEMEFYSSRIKLALVWGLGLFFVWMMNFAVAKERQACLPFPPFFETQLTQKWTFSVWYDKSVCD